MFRQPLLGVLLGVEGASLLTQLFRGVLPKDGGHELVAAHADQVQNLVRLDLASQALEGAPPGQNVEKIAVH